MSSFSLYVHVCSKGDAVVCACSIEPGVEVEVTIADI